MTRSRQDAVYALGTAMQRYQRATQMFDDAAGRHLKLGPSEMRCLDWLTEGPITAGELSVAAGLRPAATTALIDRLTAKGFVTRVPSEVDRRQVLIALTEEGTARLAEVYGPLVADGGPLFAHLGVAEIEATARLLESMTSLSEGHRIRLEGGTT